MRRTTKSLFNIGDRVIAFDADTWYITGDIGDNNIFNKKATVLRIRQTEYLEWLADVRFDNGRESTGHFQDVLKPCD